MSRVIVIYALIAVCLFIGGCTANQEQPCFLNSDCEWPLICRSGVCVVICANDRDCEVPGEVCISNVCVQRGEDTFGGTELSEEISTEVVAPLLISPAEDFIHPFSVVEFKWASYFEGIHYLRIEKFESGAYLDEMAATEPNRLLYSFSEPGDYFWSIGFVDSHCLYGTCRSEKRKITISYCATKENGSYCSDSIAGYSEEVALLSCLNEIVSEIIQCPQGCAVVTDSGEAECIDLGCTNDSDCPSDTFCAQSRCLPDICIQGDPFCEGNERRICNPNGSGSDLLETCELGCSDTGCLSSCLSDQDCLPEQFCEGAQCEPDVCIQNQPFCTENNRFMCVANGSSSSFLETCQFVCTNGFCQNACETDNECLNYQYCGGNECVQDICNQGQLFCFENERRLCNLNGSAFEIVEICENRCTNGICENGCEADNVCPENQHCENSECVEDLCNQGEYFCFENERRLCNLNGSAFEIVEICQHRCTNQVCEEECQIDEDCLENQYCQDNECLNDECEQNEFFCSGTERWFCNINGSSSMFSENCEHGCSDGICEPECTDDTDCQQLQYCHDGNCRDDVCEQNEFFCTGTERRLCLLNGAGDTLIEICEEDCRDGICRDFVCPDIQVQWTARADVIEPGSPASVSAVLNGEIHVFGGNRYLRHRIYNPSTNLWRLMSEKSNAIDEGAAVVVNGELYGFGSGLFGSNYAMRWDRQSDIWETLAANPVPRRIPMYGAIGNRVFFAGGFAGGDSVTNVYDISNDTWTQLLDLNPPGGIGAGAVYNNKLYVFDGSGRSQITQVYDPERNTWTDLTSMPTTQYGGQAVVYNNFILVAGGYHNRAHNLLTVYNPEEDEWCDSLELPVSSAFHALAIIDNRMYMIGGSREDGSNSGETWQGTILF